jgi:carboxymethylenebutenolidase
MRMDGLAVVVILSLVPSMPSSAEAGQSATSLNPTNVVVPSGALQLTGLLWTPAGAGPFPAILFSHGSSRTDPARAQDIGPTFAKHGYVFLYLFRRGHGLSAAQGEFMGDVLAREAKERGEEGRRRLQLVLLTTDHLDDVTAGLRFLKDFPSVDSGRIAAAGHSFGGQLTLLAAERDSAVRAAVTFGAAALSWAGSPELRERMFTALQTIRVPVFLTHAANDFSVAPGQALAEELVRLKKPNQLKIYPAVGSTAAAGHEAVYTDRATWESDVFGFLDAHVGRPGR